MTGKLLDTLSFPATSPSPPPWASCHLATFPCCTSVQLCPSSCPYAGCKFLIHFATLPNSFCNRRSFLFTTTLAVPCRLAAPKRSCKSNFLKFLLRHAHGERERGREGDREHARSSQWKRIASTLDSIRKPIRLRLCGSSCVCVVRLCMYVCMCSCVYVRMMWRVLRAYSNLQIARCK